jgi:hypothetical protein
MPRRGRWLVIVALALTASACHQTAVDCPSTTLPVCPEAGAPSFTDVFTNVISPLCDRCHTPGGQEAVMPLLTYQQIYGKNGVEASAIRNQVLSCLMPPPGQPEVLTDDGRQVLLTWIACGAPNDSSPTDGGGGG